MRIAFFTRGLSKVMGGMERQLLSIAEGFERYGHEVIVITLDSKDPEPFFHVNGAITFIGLGLGDPSKKATFRLRCARQKRVYDLLKKNKIDLSIAFMTGSFWYSALPSRFLKIPVILAERNGPSIYFRTSAKKLRHLIFLSMNLSSAITVQFEAYRNVYPGYLRRKIVSIPNRIPTFHPKSHSSDVHLRYIYAGRFSNQKQILELIDAFIEFHKSYPLTSLTVFGEGELQEDITRRIKMADASSFIEMNGPAKEIEMALANADVMLSPSLWEGFPNSVAEALAYGLPVGGFDDCEGVRDLVVDGRNGWLLERSNEEDPCQKLLRTIYLDKESLDMKSKAAIESMRKYQSEESNEKWVQVAQKLVDQRLSQR